MYMKTYYEVHWQQYPCQRFPSTETGSVCGHSEDHMVQADLTSSSLHFLSLKPEWVKALNLDIFYADPICQNPE